MTDPSADLQGDNSSALSLARDILNRAASQSICLRLAGSAGIVWRCVDQNRNPIGGDYVLKDLDFACRRKDSLALETMLGEFGYKNDSALIIATEGRRWTLRASADLPAVDIFFDRMEFCHPIDLRSRLSIDSQTLTLADLLLSKLQYVHPRAKDLDAMATLLAFWPFGNGDGNIINSVRINRVLASSWGFFYTALLNLDRLADRFGRDADANAAEVVQKSKLLRESASVESKGLLWRLRSWIGPRLKWYDEVENESGVF